MSMAFLAQTVNIAGRWVLAHPYGALASAVVLAASSRYFRPSPPIHIKDARKGITVKEYDVVIVGGGTAGCVLAARLSENPSITVCLLEVGESSLPVPLSQIPATFSQLFGTEFLYNLMTVNQKNAGDLARYYPRGKMLGGCSAVNAQIFHCCSPSDFDEWARTGLDGASRWSYQSLRKYFLRFEKFTPSPAHPGVDPSMRGSSGPIQTGFFSYFSTIASTFIDTCSNAGIPVRVDFNTPKGTLGVGKFITYINAKGNRVTTESAYLTPQVLLESKGGLTQACAVEISPDEGITHVVIKARKEVVLSAGAIHSPQLLMLSGIGPADHLRTHGIPVAVDLPGVGEHLMDHGVVDVVLEETGGNSLFYFDAITLSQRIKFAFVLGRYLLTGKGPMSTNWHEAGAFFRSSDPKLFPPASYPDKIDDTTSGPDAPDLEMTVSAMGYLDHARAKLPNKPTLGLHIMLLRPSSLGTVRLNSANPFDPPTIDPNYLSSPNDLNILLRGMKMLLRVAKTSPLVQIIRRDHREPAFGPDLATASDSGIAEYIRFKLESLYHPTSTARMAPLDAGGVVDSQLRVHGVANLRIVDASIFPTIPSGHTAAPTIAVAEMAADMILQARSA